MCSYPETGCRAGWATAADHAVYLNSMENRASGCCVRLQGWWVLHGAVTLSCASRCVFCLADPQRIIVDPQPAAVQHSLLEQPQSCCSSESCQAAGTKHFVPGKSSQGTGFIAKHTHMEETLWEHPISLELFKQIKKTEASRGTLKRGLLTCTLFQSLAAESEPTGKHTHTVWRKEIEMLDPREST